MAEPFERAALNWGPPGSAGSGATPNHSRAAAIASALAGYGARRPDPEDASARPDLKKAERLKFFTDAVVAIALTLLILPLVESVAAAAQDRLTTAEVLREHASQIFSFVLSFAVVATFWIGHHHLFGHVSRTSPALTGLIIRWMLTIVFLQFPTALVGALPTDPLQLALYIGMMALSSLILSAMSWRVSRTPALRLDRLPVEPGMLASALSMTALFALVLLTVVVVPKVSSFALFLLFLRIPLRQVLQPHLVGLQR